MSEFTDRTLGRYLDQSLGARQALLTDPVEHAQTWLTRRLLDAVDRAMSDEQVPADVRHRVVNRVVWGEPDGRVDVHARNRDQAAAAALAPYSL